VLNASLWFGFHRLGLERIVSTHQTDNLAADRCARKIGMARVRTTSCPSCGRSMYVYEIRRDDFAWDAADVA
jgi:RimJ/RimL family protein N-acetyltransferase